MEGRDSCFITVTGICYTHQEKERLWKDVEELFSATECRPHWGKYHSLGYHELRQRFAHLDEFCAIREKMDPDRIFVNGHIARLLGVSCRVGK
jgi:FAD/FMN-containing dehydrogenase